MTVVVSNEGRFLLYMKAGKGKAVVELHGTVDVSTARQLTLALSRLADEGIHDLVVDLTAAQLGDSAALAALVLAQRHARRSDGDLVLAGVDEDTRRVLQITGLDRTFRLVAAAADV